MPATLAGARARLRALFAPSNTSQRQIVADPHGSTRGVSATRGSSYAIWLRGSTRATRGRVKGQPRELDSSADDHSWESKGEDVDVLVQDSQGTSSPFRQF